MKRIVLSLAALLIAGLAWAQPPAPTGLWGTLNSITGRDSLHWDVSPDELVDGYRIYRMQRDDANWAARSYVWGRTHNWGIDTLTVGGIWLYAVTAVDTNVTGGWSESSRSNESDPQIFGALPPVALAANGNFDNKIQLNWQAPGTPPQHELYYDSAGSHPDCIIGGLRFNAQYSFAWLAAHYQVNGPVTVMRIKIMTWSQSTPGCPVQMGVFQDNGSGIPTLTPLSATDATIQNPSGWTDVVLSQPVTIANGSFFAAIRQVTAQGVDIGLDECAAQHPNTFFGITQPTGPWTELGSAGFPQVLAIRCVVEGGGAASDVELEPTPATYSSITPKRGPTLEIGSSGKWPVTKMPNKKATATAAMSAAVGRHTMPLSATVSSHVGITVHDEKNGHRGRHSLDQPMYIIYRDGVRRDSVEGDVTTYNDTPLPENQTHQYYVTAKYDEVGPESGPSNTVSAACNVPPSSPTNLSLAAIGATQARITWTAPTTNADGTPCVDLAGYRIYRDSVLIGIVPVGTNQYIDTPPDPTTYYTWTVKAFDEVPNISAGISAMFAVQSPWLVVPYDWVDISEIGTRTAADDDIISGPFDMGFSYQFYGGNYSQVKICSNGWITFNANETSTAFTNTIIPSTAMPSCALYPFWDDMDANPTTGGGQIKYYADVAHHRFIVAWLGVPRYLTTDYQTFEVIIDQSGSVTYNYQTIGVNNSCTVGVENCDGSDALQLAFNGTGPFLPVSNTAARFWVSRESGIIGIVRAQSPTIPIQGCRVYVLGQSDTVTTDAGGSYSIGVDPGTYSVCFHHDRYCDTCYAGVVVLQGNLTTRNAVLRQVQPTFSVTSIYRIVTVGTVRTDSFSMNNMSGPCQVAFTVADSADWISESPIAGFVPLSEIRWIRYTIGPFAHPGIYYTQIMVTFNSTSSPYRIPVEVHTGGDAVSDMGTFLPTAFALHSNYPNPFNSSTALRFEMPRGSRVDIVVYNLMGQEVAHPVGSAFTAGRYQVIFDATNLPSGAYVVRMTAGDFSQLGKMMLLK